MKLHLLIYIFLSIFALLPNSSVQVALLPNSSVQDVFQVARHWTTESSAMIGPSADVLETIGMISKKSAQFMKLAGPMGNLVAAAVETAYQPESSEYKAIALLHRRIDQQFSLTFLAIEELRTSFNYGQTIRDYANIVNQGLNILNRLFLKVIDPDFATRKIWKDKFISACNSEIVSPINILMWMNDRLNEFCPLPLKEEAQIYALLVKFFYEIEARIENDHYSWRHNYDALKFDIIINLTTESIRKAKKRIGKMRSALLPHRNTTFDNYEELNVKLKEATKFARVQYYMAENPPHEDQCFLKNVIEGLGYQREALLNFLDFARRDYVQLEMIAGICANLSTNGDEQEMQKLFYEANRIVVEMSDKIDVWVTQKLVILLSAAKLKFRKVIQLYLKTCANCELKRARVKKGVVTKPILETNYAERYQADLIDMQAQKDGSFAWILVVQEVAWPEIILEKALATYPTDVEKIDKYRYNETAEKAWYAANARGPKMYIHTVLITPDWDTQGYFWAPCAPSYACAKAIFKGTHLIITRYPKMDIDRAQRAKDWFDKFQSNITSIIEANWKTDSLPDVINQINEKTGGAIGDPSLFMNFAFLRNSILTRTEENCPIDFGIAYDFVHLPDLLPIQTIEYWGWPSWFEPTSNLEHFHLFLRL